MDKLRNEYDTIIIRGNRELEILKYIGILNYNIRIIDDYIRQCIILNRRLDVLGAYIETYLLEPDNDLLL